MKRIEEIDKNFKPSEALLKRFPNIRFIDGAKAPAKVYGLHHKGENGVFCRFPEDKLCEMSDGIKQLSYHTAGARIRFRTDSPYVAVKVTLRSGFYMRHMPLSGSSGVDIYVGKGKDSRLVKMCSPITVAQTVYEDGAYLVPSDSEDGVFYDITLTLPLYNGVTEILIGIDREASVYEPKPYTYGTVAFYGSSITQGGCASRSGTSYDGILSRRIDCDIRNLGFSGSAVGEKAMAEYIASLKLAAFVYDYDHNSPDLEHLRETHEPFFKLIRAKQPKLPVLFLSRMNYGTPEEREVSRQRRAVIYETYKRALDGGDENVYFIDGESICKSVERDCCTVDGTHPNDLGFMSMANAVEPCLLKALTKE